MGERDMQVRGEPQWGEYTIDKKLLEKVKDLSGRHIRIETANPTLVGGKIKVDSTFKRWVNETFRGKTYASPNTLLDILEKIPKSQLPFSQSNVGKLVLQKLGKLDLSDAYKMLQLEKLAQLYPEYQPLLGKNPTPAMFNKLKEFGAGGGDISKLRDHVEQALFRGKSIDLSPLDGESLINSVKEGLLDRGAAQLIRHPLGLALLDRVRAQELEKPARFDYMVRYGMNPNTLKIDEKTFAAALADDLLPQETAKKAIREMIKDFMVKAAIAETGISEASLPEGLKKLWDIDTYIKNKEVKRGWEEVKGRFAPIFSSITIAAKTQEKKNLLLNMNNYLSRIERELGDRKPTESDRPLLELFLAGIPDDARKLFIEQAKKRWKIELK